MDYIIAASTDIGLTKKTNQDSFSAKVINTNQGKIAFAVLCDGMGGLEKGEVASATIICAFNKWVETRLPELSKTVIEDAVIKNEWTSIVTEYNEKIKNYGKKSGINLGTTVTAIMITPTRYFVLNVGDTRAYEIADSLSVITKDQTVVAREVELGNITEEQAKTDPRRSVLLQCIGSSDAVYPEFFFGDTKINSVYMLCSDGFRHEITEQEIYNYLNSNVMNSENEMNANMRALIELNMKREERDNISVLTIRTF